MKITKLRNLFATPFLSLYEATYNDKKNNERKWIICSRKNTTTLMKQYFENEPIKPDAASIVAYHEEEDKIVIIKQFRIPLNDYIYELPAGLIDEGETVESTVERELKEETGLTMTNLKYTRKCFLTCGMTDESTMLSFCTCKGKLTDEFTHDSEDIQAMLLSREEAKELLLQDNINMTLGVTSILTSFVKLGGEMFK